MSKLQYEIINCKIQNRENENTKYNINRIYKVVKCTFDNTNDNDKRYFHEKSFELAKQVNPSQANDSINQRDKERLINDALGGVLAEHGWLWYIQGVYGEDTAYFTDFKGSIGQIDIKLSKNKSIEVRSSFPRNGVKFAICNNKYNFRNICKYSNFYKPDEANKDFFASVLFETPKNRLMDAEEIVFYLIGGSTRLMMEGANCYIADLTAEDDLTQVKTKYRVIDLKNALDIDGFMEYMEILGYKKKDDAN